VTGSRPDSAAEESRSSTADRAPDVVEELGSPTDAAHTGASAIAVEGLQVPPMPSGLSPGRLAVLSVAGGLTFALLTTWVARQGTSVPWVDDRIHAWVVSHRSSWSTACARAVTWGGVTTVVLPALVVVGSLAGKGGHDVRRRLGAGVLLSGVASAGIYLGLRINSGVGRQRPSVADWAGSAGGPAFPSGHTTAATLFAASCALALAARVHAGWPRRAIWVGAVVYAAAVGGSRVWLGVHWPSDVVGGWLYGLTWFTGTTALILLLRRRSAGPPAVSDRVLPVAGQSRPRNRSRQGRPSGS
jgi:membrane-associated phospholipid phosphatase